MVFDGMMSRANLLKQLDRLPRNAKRGIAVALDLSGAAVSVAVALYLRLGVWVAISGELWWALVGALFAVPVLAWFGMYRTIYRYVGRHSYRQAVRAAAPAARPASPVRAPSEAAEKKAVDSAQQNSGF